MEESKVKTAEEILKKYSFQSYTDYDENDLCFKIDLDNGVKAMEEYSQSHITKLEAKNAELKTVLLNIRDRCAKSITIHLIITRALDNEI